MPERTPAQRSLHSLMLNALSTLYRITLPWTQYEDILAIRESGCVPSEVFLKIGSVHNLFGFNLRRELSLHYFGCATEPLCRFESH